MIVPFWPNVVAILTDVSDAAQETGGRAWVVGGVVRHALLGLEQLDVDVTVEGDVPALLDLLQGRWGAQREWHGAFTTATLYVTDEYSVDIVTARREVYERPGALPIIFPSGLEDDLRRRDFTVNAMAASLEPDDFGALIDPLGGQADLEARRLRTLHPGSFQDDPTRLFRAARYAVRHDLTPDEMTDATAREAVRMNALWTVSADRRRREVERICEERQWAEKICWLNRLGVWVSLSDGWQPDPVLLKRADVTTWWSSRAVQGRGPSLETLRWLTLLANAPASLRDTLAMKPAEALTLERAQTALGLAHDAGHGEAQRALDRLPLDALLLAVTLSRTDPDKAALCHYLANVRPRRLAVTGEDLQGAGAKPGPAMGAALRETLDAVRLGEVQGRDEELRFAMSVYQRESRGEGTA